LVVLVNPDGVDVSPEMYKPKKAAKAARAAKVDPRVVQIKQMKKKAEEARILRSLGQKLPKTPAGFDGCCQPAKPKPGAKAKEEARLNQLLKSLMAAPTARSAAKEHEDPEKLDRVLDGTTIVMSHDQARTLNGRFARHPVVRKALVGAIKAEIAAGGLEAKEFDDDIAELANVSKQAHQAARNATAATSTMKAAYYRRLKAASDRVRADLYGSIEAHARHMESKEYRAELKKLTEQGMKKVEALEERLRVERRVAKLRRRKAREEAKKQKFAGKAAKKSVKLRAIAEKKRAEQLREQRAKAKREKRFARMQAKVHKRMVRQALRKAEKSISKLPPAQRAKARRAVLKQIKAEQRAFRESAQANRYVMKLQQATAAQAADVGARLADLKAREVSNKATAQAKARETLNRKVRRDTLHEHKRKRQEIAEAARQRARTLRAAAKAEHRTKEAAAKVLHAKQQREINDLKQQQREAIFRVKQARMKEQKQKQELRRKALQKQAEDKKRLQALLAISAQKLAKERESLLNETKDSDSATPKSIAAAVKELEDKYRKERESLVKERKDREEKFKAESKAEKTQKHKEAIRIRKQLEKEKRAKLKALKRKLEKERREASSKTQAEATSKATARLKVQEADGKEQKIKSAQAAKMRADQAILDAAAKKSAEDLARGKEVVQKDEQRSKQHFQQQTAEEDARRERLRKAELMQEASVKHENHVKRSVRNEQHMKMNERKMKAAAQESDNKAIAQVRAEAERLRQQKAAELRQKEVARERAIALKNAELAKKAAVAEKVVKARLREQAMKAGGRPLPLTNGFKPFAQGFRSPMFSKLSNFCVLSGTAFGNNLLGRMAHLPVKCRPKARHVFNQFIRDDTVARLDILPNGRITGYAPDRKNEEHSGAVTYEGTIYPVGKVAGTKLALAPGWVPYGPRYAAPVWMKSGGLCVVSGMIRTQDRSNNKWNSLLFTLPPACRPADGRLVFSLNGGSASHRVDVLKDGSVRWVIGNRKQPVLSLNGIAFFTHSSRPIQLLNGLTRYANDYRTPTWNKKGRFCVVSGLVHFPKPLHSSIGKLPPPCRPAAKISFHVNSHDRYARVDVLPSGDMEFVSHNITAGFLLSRRHSLHHQRNQRTQTAQRLQGGRWRPAHCQGSFRADSPPQVRKSQLLRRRSLLRR